MPDKYLSHYAEIEPFVTKDGSVIRELMHPLHHASQVQSLAGAQLAAGQKTLLHRHRLTEELYYITDGKGMMTIDEQRFEVQAGDTICISPGQAHCIENVAAEELRLLCCCSPAYSHEDKEIIETLLTENLDEIARNDYTFLFAFVYQTIKKLSRDRWLQFEIAYSSSKRLQIRYSITKEKIPLDDKHFFDQLIYFKNFTDWFMCDKEENWDTLSKLIETSSL